MVLVAMVTHVGKKRNLDEAAATTYSKAEGKKRAPTGRAAASAGAAKARATPRAEESDGGDDDDDYEP